MNKKYTIIILGCVVALAAILVGGFIISDKKEIKPQEPAIEINTETTVLDVMNIILPQGISVGEFDRYLEQGGGVPILNSRGEEVGIIGIHRITEGIEPVYAVSLYEEYFNYEEAIDFVESVTFSDEAFKEPTEDVVDDWGQQFTN